MKYMKKFKTNLTIMSVFLIAGVLTVPASYASSLSYQGNSEGQGSGNVTAASSNLVPVGGYANTVPQGPMQHSTNYGAQFSPYASFMNSPYQGGQGSAGGAYAPSASPYGALPAGGTYNPDPYGASEVSPYAKYSPYIEVVGEGSDYTLGVDDVITIIVRNQPDFSGRFVIDPEGNVQYPFIGDIKAEGLTKDELKAAVVDRMRDFVRYPEVAVMISEYRSKAIYVFGFVNGPGKYAMKGNKITVKEAVVAAGLPREDAALSRVYVIRPSEFRENGKAAKKKVDLQKLLQKGDSAEDFLLKPGDTIVVHQRYFDKFVNTFSRLVGPLFQGAATYELLWGDIDGGIIGGGASGSSS